MKYLNIKSQFAFLAVTALFVTSCKKVDVAEPMGTAGQTIVKLVGGGTTSSPGILKSPIDFLPKPVTLIAADLRRDIPNETELNRVMHVIIKDDTAAVRTANSAYKILPAAWYTLNTPKTGGLGGVYNVTIPSGETQAPITVTIPDATVLDPSSLYALGFTITTVDANGKISGTNTTVVEIGAKNAYDGVYAVVSGTVTRYTAPGVPAGDALSGDLTGNPDIQMITGGSYILKIPPPGSPGALYWAAAATSQVAGIDGVTATVDPNTNLVTMASAGNATLTNWAGHINSYDPSTKTFHLSFRWNPTANVREYEVIMKYKGPR